MVYVNGKTFQTLGDIEPIKFRKTGLPHLDYVLGGGFPHGGFVQIYGPESSGKTTLVLQVIAKTQELEPDRDVAYFDVDHSLDKNYALALGVQPKLIYDRPDTIEDCWKKIFCLLDSKPPALIVIDSEALSPTDSELESEMDAQAGVRGRAMSDGINRGLSRMSDTTIVVISQIRAKIGVTYGAPESITGGNTIRYAASIRIDLRRIQTMKYGMRECGIVTKMKVAKSKVAAPFAAIEAPLFFGSGFSEPISLAYVAEKMGVLNCTGNTFHWVGKTKSEGTIARNELDLHSYFSDPENRKLLAMAMEGHLDPVLLAEAKTKFGKTRGKKNG